MPAAAPIRTNNLADLCRRVGTALGAGVEARQIWAREAQRGPSRQRAAVSGVSRGIDGGASLADMFDASRGFFPPVVCEMVRVGEETGQLDRVFLRLADQYDHLLRLRRTFLAGIAWPLIQLGIAVVVIGLLIWIMGLIGQMSGQPDEAVDVLGFNLVGTRGLMIYATAVGGVALLFVLLLQAVRRGWFWTRPLQQVVMITPGLGPPLRTLALSRIAWVMAMTLDTGMETRRALRLALGNTRNVYFSGQAELIARKIAAGEPIHEAFRAARRFPEDFLDAVEVGEQSGRLPESMRKLAELYQDRARSALGVLTMVAGFVVWAMVAALIIGLIFRLAASYFGQINSLLQEI